MLKHLYSFIMEKRILIYILMSELLAINDCSSLLQVQLIFVKSGQSIVLKNTIGGHHIEWFGPYIDTYVHHQYNVIDKYGRKTSWNTSQYTENQIINPHIRSIGIPQINLKGNHSIGEYLLEVVNITKASEGLYVCDALNITGEFSSSTDAFFVQTKDHQSLEITPSSHIYVVEGSDLNVCCHAKTKYMQASTLPKWFNLTRGQERLVDAKITCITVPIITKNDSRVYTCIDKTGTDVVQAELTVLYPPTIQMVHEYPIHDRSYNIIKCLADGCPDNYSYGKWEHLSIFNEHIRYIDPPERSVVKLRRINSIRSWYHDDGYYVCKVSNGVQDKKGNYFQLGTTIVTGTGPPVFIPSNKRVQFITVNEPMNFSVIVYNSSELTCNYVTENEKIVLSIDIYFRRSKISDIIYGQNISMFGTEITYTMYNRSSGLYVATVCNLFGTDSFKVDLRVRNTDEYPKETGPTHVAAVILITVLCSCLSVFAVALIALVSFTVVQGIRKKKRSRNVTLYREDAVHEYDEINENELIDNPPALLPVQSGSRNLDETSAKHLINTSMDDNSADVDSAGYLRPIITQDESRSANEPLDFVVRDA